MRLLLFFVITTLLIFSCTGNNLNEYTIFIEKVDSIERANKKTKILTDGWYQTSKNNKDFKRISEYGEIYYLDPRPVILTDNFESYGYYVNSDGDPGIKIQLDKTGIREWKNTTERNIGLHLIFVLDNKIIHSPLVNQPITNGLTVFFFSKLTEKQLKKIINQVKK